MFVISREEAICLFYAVPYNKENAEKYTKIDEIEAVTICYSVYYYQNYFPHFLNILK